MPAGEIADDVAKRDMKEYIASLEQVQIFADLSREEMIALLDIGTLRTFKEGETIIQEGDLGDEMYVLLEGDVQVAQRLMPRERRPEFEMEDASTGFRDDRYICFGEIAMLDRDERTASIVAVTDCITFVLERERLDRFCEAHPRLGYSIMRRIAQVVTGRVRSELEHVLTLNTVLQVARDVQVGLLPKGDPHIERFDIAGRCIPANSVGGDHYTYVWLDEEKTKLAIVLADVSGKGMKAAMMVMRFAEILRYEAEGRRSPGRILAELNRSLYGRMEGRMYVTACVGVLDVSERSLEISTAGHPPVYCLSGRAGTVEALGGSRYPLGIREHVDYEERKVKLEERDVLVFYTDGIVEARDGEGCLYGFDRLEGAIRDAERETSAQEMVDRILGEMHRFSSTSQRGVDPGHEDDMTLVVVRVL